MDMHGSRMWRATSGRRGSAMLQPRLVRAAHEFEAQMMKELLRPHDSSGSLTGDGDERRAVERELWASLPPSRWRALSEQGGFGIADRILHDLSRSGNIPEAAPVTGNVHIDTG